MSAATAIGAVSESLRNLLVGEIEQPPTVHVTILAPDEASGEEPRVNLFLYKVQENAFLRNLDWQPKPGNPQQLVPPPLSLNLYYLMTPYTQNDNLTGNSTAHAYLGKAMRVFYEFPVVPQAYLHDDLKAAREELRIVQNSVDMEELSRVWSTFSEPFRLSVMYEVSVVQLDMPPAAERPLAKRVKTIGVPQVQAPFRPPIINSMTPGSGQASAMLTFKGKELAGWSADVSMGGQQLTTGLALTGDTFTATIPAGTAVGFYEVTVTVADLYRRTFFFEVTP